MVGWVVMVESGWWRVFWAGGGGGKYVVACRWVAGGGGKCGVVCGWVGGEVPVSM